MTKTAKQMEQPVSEKYGERERKKSMPIERQIDREIENL
jgi:hypothetical protein